MAFVVSAALQRNRTAGPIVADGVACQIIDELVDQARHAFDDHRLGLMTYRHIRLTGNLFKTLLNRVDRTRELNRLRGPNGHCLAFSCTFGLVQVRQRKDVVDKRCQAARLTIDATAKVAQVVLALDHAICDELGIARNRRKRRLELMGDIRRELAAHTVVVR